MSSEKIHNIAFGIVLREERKIHGFTQESFGFASGLDRSYISLLELGLNSPTLNTIVDICNAFHLSLGDFAKKIDLKIDQLTKKQ